MGYQQNTICFAVSFWLLPELPEVVVFFPFLLADKAGALGHRARRGAARGAAAAAAGHVGRSQLPGGRAAGGRPRWNPMDGGQNLRFNENSDHVRGLPGTVLLRLPRPLALEVPVDDGSGPLGVELEAQILRFFAAQSGDRIDCFDC